MLRRSPFKHHRFPRDIILRAVRWYLRYPLSYKDMVELLAEREITVDRSTVYRWVQKFGPELTKRTEKYLRRVSVDWHVDESYVRVGASGVIFGGLSMQTVRWSISASRHVGTRKPQRPF